MKVIFRKNKKDGSIEAFFPETRGDFNPSCMMCYSHIGQHGEACLEYYYKDTIPAMPDEYKDPLKELELIGYNSFNGELELEIRKRIF
jgi:hypothetical protein